MMNPKEVISMINVLSQQKGLDKEAIAGALEYAIAGAVSKQLHCPHETIKVSIDKENGYYTIWQAVIEEDAEEPAREEKVPAPETETSDTEPDLDPNPDPNPDNAETSPNPNLEFKEIPGIEFDRIAIQTAKHLIMQKVREAERKQLVEDYRPKLGKVLSGVVKRITRTGDIIVLLNERVEAILPQDAMLPQDKYYPDDDISAVLELVDAEKSMHQLYLSRTSDNMIRGLFVREVPEVAQQIVEIRAIARLPGLRCKVAVRAKDKRIDPMSACIGMQGKRVQAVEEELRGEKVDILEWSDSPEQLVRNVLANRNIIAVTINTANRNIDVAADADNIGEILGRNGQNVRLAVRLIGWDINVMRADEAKEKHEQALEALKSFYIRVLDLEDDIAMDLIESGFTSIQQIAYAPTEKLLRIKDFDEELVEELCQRASDYLMSEAFRYEATKELIEIEGINNDIANCLIDNKVFTRKALAECSLDELNKMLGESFETELGEKIILAARQIDAD